MQIIYFFNNDGQYYMQRFGLTQTFCDELEQKYHINSLIRSRINIDRRLLRMVKEDWYIRGRRINV